MKAIIVLHISLFFIGLILGLFAEHEIQGQNFPWSILFFVPFAAFICIVVVLGFFVLVSNSSAIKYFAWFIYLCSAFGVSVSLGLIFQSVINNQIIPGSFFTLLGSIGYLIGLMVVFKLQRWRHGTTF